MGEYKNYYYTVHTDISRALKRYNTLMPKGKFTILDSNILSMIRSFNKSNTKFFMSNKELADIMITDPATIQKAINRLCAAGLIKKENIYSGPRPQRVLHYQEMAVQKLLATY